MNEVAEVEPTGDGQQLPANSKMNRSALGEVTRIHRRGGYFVGVAGWPGLVFWLVGKLSFFLASGVVWAILGALAWTVVDEAVRTQVRSVLGESANVVTANDEGREFPLLRSDAYQQLSTNWKRLLAEVQFDQSNYPARFVSIVRELTANDVAILRKIAPYVVGSSIVKADDFELGYEIPSAEDVEFERLKTIGITTEGQFGLFVEVKPKHGQPAQHSFAGTTLGLAVRSPDPEAEFDVHVIPLTEEGKQIIRLLNEPTSLEGICGIASGLRERKKIEAFVFARLEPKSGEEVWSNRVNVSEVCSRYEPPTG